MGYLLQNPQEMILAYAALGILIGILFILLVQTARKFNSKKPYEKTKSPRFGFHPKDDE